MTFQNPPSQAPATLDYVPAGPAPATFSARLTAPLADVVIALPGQVPHFQEDVRAALEALGDRPRLYYDARLALALELHHALPFAPSYDDVRALLALLQQPEPLALNQPADALAASLARVAQCQRLTPELLRRVESEGLGPLYREIELPVAIVTAVMICQGLRVNRQVLQEIRTGQYSRMEVARRTLRREARHDFNPDDAASVRRLLYNDLGLPCPLETRQGNQAVSKAALAQLQPLHPLVAQLQTYRDAKSAYDSANAIHNALGPNDTIVRGNLDPLGTETGRYSCSDPPLQALDKRVRRAIEAAPGHLLVEADYSQMELRVLAHFSQDPALLHAFEHAIDLHVRTAAQVLGIAESDVNDQQRALGKTLNFGIVYGQTAYGLAEELGVPQHDAQTLLAAHAAAYPGVAAWIAQVHQQAANTGEVRTLFGRRRQLPDIYSALPCAIAAAQRQAVNTIIQGTAADLLKLALVRLHGDLPAEVTMLLPVHDSVLLEVPADAAEATREIVTTAMQTKPIGFTVPLKIDVHTGRNWAECK